MTPLASGPDGWLLLLVIACVVAWRYYKAK